MRGDVKQRTSGALLQEMVAPGSTVYADEYDIYARLPQWGYTHHTVRHASVESARNDDGDCFCEAQVNTLERLWTLLRSWPAPIGDL
jgi:hypothetical protein